MSLQEFNFEANTWKILDLLSKSIYSNKEIFLRELISNASDALYKAKLTSLTNPDYLWNDIELKIKIEIDEQNWILIINDNWIWMNKDDLIKNLWTIAHSWTKQYLENLEWKQSDLIWQFWVWFYSVFMVCDKVEVVSKTFDLKTGYIYISDGKGKFSIDESTIVWRWTSVMIYLKQECKEFLDYDYITNLVKKYSNYIQFPILLKEKYDNSDPSKIRQFKQINDAIPIWTKSKNTLKTQDYLDYYKSKYFEDAFFDYIHLNIEWTLNFKALLYIPIELNRFMNYDNNIYWPSLFVQNVLIKENCVELVNPWLRFIKWVVECPDLSLNISREILQENNMIIKLKQTITNEIIKKLEFLKTQNVEKYDIFVNNFWVFLKEWILNDFSSKDKLMWLLKYESIIEKKLICLDDYIKTKKIDDKKIYYYILNKKDENPQFNPFVQNYQNKWIDVLIFKEFVDEWIIKTWIKYNDFEFVSVTHLKDENESNENIKKINDENKSFLNFFYSTISNSSIENVEFSDKIWDNLCAVWYSKWSISKNFEQTLKSMWQNFDSSKKIIYLNFENNLIQILLKKYNENCDLEKIKKWVLMIYELWNISSTWELFDQQKFLNNFIEILNEFINK